jgi:CelD/BcsL family acetyltransferase involved in cellulose biosynthesis
MYTVEIIDNTARLRSEAAAWDDLWLRSPVTLPTARAMLVSQWVDQLAPSAEFRAIVVRDAAGRFVAGLPLVARNWFGVFSVGDLPTGEWATGGDLLVDFASDVPAVMDLLVSAIKLLPWEILWLEYANYELPGWKALFAALERAKIGVDLHEKFRIGQIEIGHDWDAYEATFSKNHRKNIGRLARKTERETKASFKFLTEIPADELGGLLRRGFEVEDRSWKGQAGTSVLKTRGMFEFFHEQARHLSRIDSLALGFLEFDGQPVAFAYGYQAKGVFHFFKWGYDETWQAFSPGQQLAERLLRMMHADHQWRMLDLAGPLTDTTARWMPQTSFSVGRVVIAPTALLGRALFFAYQNFAPLVRRWRSAFGTPPADAIPAQPSESQESAAL